MLGQVRDALSEMDRPGVCAPTPDWRMLVFRMDKLGSCAPDKRSARLATVTQAPEEQFFCTQHRT